MKIKIKDLIRIIDRLRNSLLHYSNEDMDLKDIDYYWDIDEDEFYDPLNSPDVNNFSLGQLSDDWQELFRLLEINSIPILYDFKRLSMILKALSDKSNIVLY